MLTLQPLRTDQYRQVAEWEYGPQPDNTDWQRHAREMEDPRFRRYGVYLDGGFAGCISLEQISRNIAGFHVATKRRTFHPDHLAQILLDIAGQLFTRGVLACVANAPIDRPAVARLARRCGMYEYGHTPTTRFFMLTRGSYARSKTAANEDAI